MKVQPNQVSNFLQWGPQPTLSSPYIPGRVNFDVCYQYLLFFQLYYHCCLIESVFPPRILAIFIHFIISGILSNVRESGSILPRINLVPSQIGHIQICHCKKELHHKPIIWSVKFGNLLIGLDFLKPKHFMIPAFLSQLAFTWTFQER